MQAMTTKRVVTSSILATVAKLVATLVPELCQARQTIPTTGDSVKGEKVLYETRRPTPLIKVRPRRGRPSPALPACQGAIAHALNPTHPPRLPRRHPGAVA